VAGALLVAVLYALHQDIWFWNTARPLVFGFLPIGLVYHVVHTLASSLLLWWLVRRYWPSHLDDPHRSRHRVDSA
jgi:membrane protein implicated in regulation of membrane protease activity